MWYQAMMVIALIPEGVAAAMVARLIFFVRLVCAPNLHRRPLVSLALVQELALRTQSAERRV